MKKMHCTAEIYRFKRKTNFVPLPDKHSKQDTVIQSNIHVMTATLFLTGWSVTVENVGGQYRPTVPNVAFQQSRLVYQCRIIHYVTHMN